jgi:hypothetical protein
MHMATEAIEIEISGREAKLILKYGYPFPDEAKLFQPFSGKAGYHTISIDKYWLEIIIGDLCRSIKEVKSHSLIDELDELCDVLESCVCGGKLIKLE